MQTSVDNKRKQLEKNLSAAQRDQMFLKLAKDELKMKEAMVASLGESDDSNDSDDSNGDGSSSKATSPINSTSQPNANVQWPPFKPISETAPGS